MYLFVVHVLISVIVRNVFPILSVGAVRITVFSMISFVISSVSVMSISVYGMPNL
jgi:hypothetical protein